jgi:hypothetical protein
VHQYFERLPWLLIFCVISSPQSMTTQQKKPRWITLDKNSLIGLLLSFKSTKYYLLPNQKAPLNPKILITNNKIFLNTNRSYNNSYIISPNKTIDIATIKQHPKCHQLRWLKYDPDNRLISVLSVHKGKSRCFAGCIPRKNPDTSTVKLMDLTNTPQKLPTLNKFTKYADKHGYKNISKLLQTLERKKAQNGNTLLNLYKEDYENPLYTIRLR